MDKKRKEKIIGALKKATSANDLKIVSLDDTIDFKCNNCGSCCIGVNVTLTAFDFFRAVKEIGVEEVMENVEFHIESNGIPRIDFNHGVRGVCPFLKDNLEGDFVCGLNDNKPLTCDCMFIATSTSFTDELAFVPLDQDVPPIDIDKFVEDSSFDNKIVVFTEDKKNAVCKCKGEEILVRDAIPNRVKYNRENSIAQLLGALPLRYVPLDKFFTLLKYVSRSKCNLFDSMLNSIDGEEKEGTSPFKMIIHFLYNCLYFYFSPEKDMDKDFYELTEKHIRKLESVKLLSLRILYKHILYVMAGEDKTLDAILDEDDEKKAQEQFDNYYSKHQKEISKRFEDDLSNLLNDLKKVPLWEED